MTVARAVYTVRLGFSREAAHHCAAASYDAYFTSRNAAVETQKDNWKPDHYAAIEDETASVLVMVKGNCALIAFRGTDFKDSGEHIRNLKYWPLQWREHKVHSGFLRSFQRLWSSIDGFLQSSLAQPETADVVLCGHSAGGAMAGLCSWNMEQDTEYNVAAVYTFGSPRFADAKLADKMSVQMNGRLFRIVNKGDPVPRLVPPWRYRHCGDHVYYDRNDRMQWNPPLYRVLWDRVRGQRYSLEHHSASGYAALFI